MMKKYYELDWNEYPNSGLSVPEVGQFAVGLIVSHKFCQTVLTRCSTHGTPAVCLPSLMDCGNRVADETSERMGKHTYV